MNINKACRPSKQFSAGIRKMIPVVAAITFLYTPTAVGLTLDESRHLVTRTGFGATVDELASLSTLNHADAVDYLLSGLRTHAITPEPLVYQQSYFPKTEAASNTNDNYRCLWPENEASIRGIGKKGYFTLHNEHWTSKSWWWREILQTPSPFTEKLTYFWHDHFAVGASSSIWSKPIYDYNKLLRKHSSGNLKELAKSILKNPAMLNYLTNTKNIKTHANENLAREFLELFSMGVGNYSENDIKELGKVLSGHSVDTTNCGYVFNPDEAFKGEVSILGKTAEFSVDEAVDHIFSFKQVSLFIAEKLWREFVSPTPTSADLEALATVFRKADYEIKPTLRYLLTSDAFWSTKNRGTLIKSPVELLAGTVRSFDIWMPDPDLLIIDSTSLENNLLDPPSVEGWPQQRAWVSPNNLVKRKIALNRLWQAKRNADHVFKQRLLDDKQEGLTLRVSAISGDYLEAMSFDVVINGTHTTTFQSTIQAKQAGHSKLGLRPIPETFYIPKHKLPEQIQTVRLSLNDSEIIECGESPTSSNVAETDTQDCTTFNRALLTHWVQLNDRKYIAHHARQQYLDGRNQDGIPTGMLYSDGYLEFDVRKLNNRFKKNTNVAGKLYPYHLDTPIVRELYFASHGEDSSYLINGNQWSAATVNSATKFKTLNRKKNRSTVSGVPIAAIVPLSISEELPKIARQTSPLNSIEFLSTTLQYQFK